ncbi:MAG: thioredoxin family protein [Ignavibacteriae bacterium]|nr:thioredoxin family protein [Ignavibacteriota bacterium]
MNNSFHLPLIIFLILLFIVGCATTKPIAIKPNEHIEIGWTPRAVLETKTYPWFDSNYVAYKPNGEIFSQLKSIQDSLSFLVIYGTWCSDSKRELPRFFKIMDSMNVKPEQIILYAVDRTKMYPPGIPQEYNPTHVPTFILKYRGMEVGRIIEAPKGTLEQDMFNQLFPLTQ